MSVCPVSLSYDFLACIHCVLSLIMDTLYVVVPYYMFMCVSCCGLVVSNCQVIGLKDSSDDTFMW